MSAPGATPQHTPGPLRRCTADGELLRCDMSAAFDRLDGLCYFHGKRADGLFQPQAREFVRPAIGRPSRWPWDELFDGDSHTFVPGVRFSRFERAALIAAARRGLDVTVEHAYDRAVTVTAARRAA